MQMLSKRFLGFLCAGLATVAASGQAVSLKLKFTEGKTDFFEQVDDVEQAMKGGPMGGGDDEKGITIKVKQLYCMARKVESVSKDKSLVTYTYDRLAMNFDSPMMPPIVYDSDLKKQDADAAMVEDIFGAMLGSVVKVELEPNGAVKSVNGMKALCEKVEAKAAGNMFWGQMKEELTDDSFALQMFKSRYSLLPEKEVKAGDTWNSKTSDKMPRIGTLIRDMKCTLKSVDKKEGKTIATITYEGKISAEAPAASQPGDGGMTVSVEDGTSKGTLEFDVDAGDFARTESESLMNMKVMMGASDKPMKLALKTKGTSRNLGEKERTEQKKAANAEKPADKASEKTESPAKKTDKP